MSYNTLSAISIDLIWKFKIRTSSEWNEFQKGRLKAQTIFNSGFSLQRIFVVNTSLKKRSIFEYCWHFIREES